MPHELSFLGVFFSPLVLSCFFGFSLAALVGTLMARLGWLRFFANPPWVITAVGIIIICLLSMTVLPL